MRIITNKYLFSTNTVLYIYNINFDNYSKFNTFHYPFVPQYICYTLYDYSTNNLIICF